MVEPVSIGASILASSTANYVYSKGKQMHFLNEAVENAASQVAENHEGLDSDVFIHIFQKDEVIELVEEFDDGNNLITPEDIASSFEDDLLGEEVEAPPEELILEFLNKLEIEISQDQEIGNKLRTIYLQRIHQYSEDLDEGQEEILRGIQEIEARIPTDKGYDIFQPIHQRFEKELDGEDPANRYDLPLFGREEELDKVRDFAEADEDVLILAGRAGIGKTRLAVEGSLLLETEHPNWQVYWTDIDAGNIDDGLEDLDLEERNTILFVDDARNTGQIRRLFDLVDQHQPRLKLIFAERSHFTSTLQSHGNRLRGVETDIVELPRLDTDDVHQVLQEYYGITDPSTLERITAISEGIPLYAHLLAEQRSRGEQADSMAQDEVLEEVFEDVLKDIQRLDTVGDSQDLETYVKYLAAVGELDTNNDEQIQRFRDVLNIDSTTEENLRETLTEHIGMVTERGGTLTIQPDALQEYIVYDSFFSDSPRDYKDKIYENFSEFTGKNQINQLAVIHRRYDCRDARRTIREALDSELEQLSEYGFAERVKLLRRFKVLGSVYPHHAIELFKKSFREELPEDQEDEPLIRSSMYTASPAGDFIIESIDLLSNALQGEPEEAAVWLLRIAVDYPSQSQLRTESVEQKLKQAMRPGLRRSPAAQQKILKVIGENFLNEEIEKELRLDLLDIIGETSKIEIHDFSVDPVDHSKMRSWQGDLRMTEPRIELRKQAVEHLIEIIWEDPHPELRRKAAKKLVSFENSQARHHGKHQEVISNDELVRILEFASEYVSQDQDLQCIDTLSKLADRENAKELGIESEVQELEEALAENERFRLLQNMRYNPPTKMEEREAEIRSFAEDLDEEELEPSDFSNIVSELTNTSFHQFFRVLADERPEYGEKLLEADAQGLDSCKPQILVGICSTDPEKGKELVEQYTEEERFNLISAGLSALATQDLDFAKENVNELLEDRSEIPPELVSGLSQVVHGYWEDHQEWTENVLLTLLQGAESLEPRSIKAVLQPLPLHKDDSQEVGEDILKEVLDYAEDRENFANEPHGLKLAIEEVAERDPEQFVDFCLQRLENGHTGTSILPAHIDVDTERMTQAEGYSNAVDEVASRILDADYYNPIGFSALTRCFPTADLAERLTQEIPDCSEDELMHIIWYVRQYPVTEDIEEIYLIIITEGVDDINSSETVKNEILTGLSSDPLTTPSMGVDMKEDELEMVRNWQRDSSLSSSIHRFAEEAEDYLLKDVEQRENRFKDF
ncbi:ATP-binding protein [Salinirussus salinus]|uniref:ATP-binding protein n=1 Tax=Salinirussus salinus TaxID=1198300 RepID=UPI001916AAF1|nr:ATP-binding protein [Salinirussus salinus]